MVVNYDLPTKPENYLHRMWQGLDPPLFSLRFRRKVAVVNFVTDESQAVLQDIERFYNTGVRASCRMLACLLTPKHVEPERPWQEPTTEGALHHSIPCASCWLPCLAAAGHHVRDPGLWWGSATQGRFCVSSGVWSGLVLLR
jgi:hypothetical protein